MWGFLFFLPLLTGNALAGPYQLTDSYAGQGFLDGFYFEAISDPTRGRVNYVDAGTASQENLTYASNGHFVLRADFTSYLDPNGPGRDSVRIKSNNQYTTSVMIFNLYHMPAGCGTWPAIWTVGNDWPNQGEIDILEGINDLAPNQVTLHTGSGCTMPASRPQTGTSGGDNCDSYATNNVGCGVRLTSSNGNYGHQFNANGGGWYAIERSTNGIKVWFWSRVDSAPQDVQHGTSTVNTDNWGMPAANFPSGSCDISQYFGPHNIVINLDFCGDWAGAAYAQSGCPSTCVDFVNNNPGAFQDSYFDIAWLNVYT